MMYLWMTLPRLPKVTLKQTVIDYKNRLLFPLMMKGILLVSLIHFVLRGKENDVGENFQRYPKIKNVSNVTLPSGVMFI